MTRPREVDLGWWDETDGRRARLTWAEELGGTLYVFHATGESEPLYAGVGEADASAVVETLWAGPRRSLEDLRAALAAVLG